MALYNLKNPYDLQKFKERANLMCAKQEYVELKRKLIKRSSSQNSYLHLLLGYFASEFGYTLDEVKVDIFKRICNRNLFERNRNNKRGFDVTYLRSSADLDKKEMTIAIDRFRNYSSAKCGLYLPESNENEALFFAQQQMEQYEEFM